MPYNSAADIFRTKILVADFLPENINPPKFLAKISSTDLPTRAKKLYSCFSKRYMFRRPNACSYKSDGSHYGLTSVGETAVLN